MIKSFYTNTSQGIYMTTHSCEVWTSARSRCVFSLLVLVMMIIQSQDMVSYAFPLVQLAQHVVFFATTSSNASNSVTMLQSITGDQQLQPPDSL